MENINNSVNTVGIKDDTLEKTILAFDLEKVPYVIDYKIPCNEILGIYKSKKKAYSSRVDPNRAYTCHNISGIEFMREQTVIAANRKSKSWLVHVIKSQ